MEPALRSPSNNPSLEPPRPQRMASRDDWIRPIPTIAQIQHRSEEDLGAEARCEQQHGEFQQQPELQQPQSERGASNTSENHRPPSFPHLSSRDFLDGTIPSPLYQTVIPAFHPNHYDLNNSTVCLCIPLTAKTPLHRWRERRRSIKELRTRDDEMRREYERLKHIESRFRGELPPYVEARKECVDVRNDRIEQPRTATVPSVVLNQQRVGPK